jgi:hypothetical protein
MGISKLPANMTPARWELVFYILGAATCLWAFVLFFFLPDNPSNARFFNHRERLVAVKRVAGNETGIKNKAFNRKQAILAFYDPKTIILFISVFAAAIPNGVVNSFSTVIIRDMGFSTTMTTELKSVGDAVQIVALFIGEFLGEGFSSCSSSVFPTLDSRARSLLGTVIIDSWDSRWGHHVELSQ